MSLPGNKPHGSGLISVLISRTNRLGRDQRRPFGAERDPAGDLRAELLGGTAGAVEAHPADLVADVHHQIVVGAEVAS